VRENKKLTAITAVRSSAERFTVEARLGADGTLTMAIGGDKVAEVKAPGAHSNEPKERLCVGFDEDTPVDDYSKQGRFSGNIKNLKITSGTEPSAS
jgi:hypothetical protein